jgi:uncharacterized protein (UPF0276 family)
MKSIDSKNHKNKHENNLVICDGQTTTLPLIGVGLRHEHFSDALTSAADIDFIEVHAENFFAEGGASQAVIENAHQLYNISLHSTAMGLGSSRKIPMTYLDKLKVLADNTSPILMSDHVCFTWGEYQDNPINIGDLLPIVYNESSLIELTNNIDHVQQYLGRSLLMENLSSYVHHSSSSMSEIEFLIRLTELSGCQLLLDLNNVLVNINNDVKHNSNNKLNTAIQWIKQIPSDRVGEIHLAGYSPVLSGQLAIDDHSQPVSNDGWSLYKYALQHFGNVPTLIEWDNNLPTWKTLIAEADKAKKIAIEVFHYD